MHLSHFRPRFTVRRLMIVVVVVGLASGAEVYRRRLVLASVQHHAAAELSRAIAQTYESAAVLAESERGFSKMFPDVESNPVEQLDDKSIAKCRRMATYLREVAVNHDRAARYPWLSVAPDPPKPE